MRKLLIASVVAIMAFASAAFATTFDTNETVLASSTGDVINCGEATVTWGIPYSGTYNSATDDWQVSGATVTFDGSCDGQNVAMILLDGSGTQIQGGGENIVGYGEVNSGVAEVVFEIPALGRDFAFVNVGQVEDVSIFVEDS